MTRDSYTYRHVEAGCETCSGCEPMWGMNGHGVAARHHDLTGHATWVRVNMTFAYGRPLSEQSNEPLKDADLPGQQVMFDG